MNKEIEEKIKKMELKYKFIKDQIKQELFFEFAKRLKEKWTYLTFTIYDTKHDPNYEEEVESVFKELIEEYEKGYDSGYITELDELREKFDGLEQRYEAKRDTLFKLETVQGEQLNELKKIVVKLPSKILINKITANMNRKVLRESSQVLRGLIYDLHQNKSISNHI